MAFSENCAGVPAASQRDLRRDWKDPKIAARRFIPPPPPPKNRAVFLSADLDPTEDDVDSGPSTFAHGGRVFLDY